MSDWLTGAGWWLVVTLAGRLEWCGLAIWVCLVVRAEGNVTVRVSVLVRLDRRSRVSDRPAVGISGPHWRSIWVLGSLQC